MRRLDGKVGDRLCFEVAPIGFDEIDRAAESADVVFLDYLQLVHHPVPTVSGAERIEGVVVKIAEAAQRTGTRFIIASAQGRDGGSLTRDIHNATKGSSSIEFTVDALYSATSVTKEERKNPLGFTVKFQCLKQREGELVPVRFHVNGMTNAIGDGVVAYEDRDEEEAP